MTVSIRTSLAISAVALALLCAGFAVPQAHGDTLEDAHAASDTCTLGRQQSPIDLTGAIPADMATPRPSWTAVHGGAVLNTGHTIQVNLSGAGTLDLGGATYSLQQFHFHHPSEHTIDGKAFPLELHLVHAAQDGRLAVVGVLFEEGPANPALDAVWATAPGREGKAAVAFDIDAADFLPKGGGAFRYEGSLTTPPCSETVSWTVMATPLTASHAQIAAFAAMFPDNARAVQQINRRFILKTP
jgi:carbonic anhydrase